MRDEIYQTELLKLAARARGAGRLDEPRRSARVDNPLCGDRITLDVRLGDRECIQAIGYDVKACLLCQAAASLIGEHAPGHAPAELEHVHAALEAMLKQGAPPPGGAFETFRAFEPVRAHKSRHRCVLLPFEALRAALASDQASGS